MKVAPLPGKRPPPLDKLGGGLSLPVASPDQLASSIAAVNTVHPTVIADWLTRAWVSSC